MAARGDGAHRDAGAARAAVVGACRSSSIDAELGAVELCLAARLLGAHLASTPFLGSAAAALRVGVRPSPERGRAIALRRDARSSTPHEVDRFAVVGRRTPSRSSPRPAPRSSRRPSLDIGTPAVHRAPLRRRRARIEVDRRAAHRDRRRCSPPRSPWARPSACSTTRATTPPSAASSAARSAPTRRCATSWPTCTCAARARWSTVLYAAAALDDELPDAQRTAAIAKAYVARAAREVAHGALQVFGGIAFTEEHQAHRFLRRIIVREQQFGDAAHHERELGRALAGRPPWNAAHDRDRLQRPDRATPRAHQHRRRPGYRRPAARRRAARSALAGLRRRADLRRQVEPDLSRRLRRRRAHPAPPAARPHPADRARHGPRVPRAHRARRHRRPRAAHALPRRRRSARRST